MEVRKMSHGVILGIAVGAVAVILLWYNLHGALVNWILVGAGLLSAGLLAKWIDPYKSWEVGGVAIAGIITIILMVIFYAEVIKGQNKHPWIAPAVSFMVGVAVVLTLGSVGQVILPAAHLPAVTSVVKHNGN
jgi:hypothetical protein